jgi:TonB family protein
VRSDEKGSFEVAGLPAGTYDLEARLPGFSSLRGQVQIAGLDVQRTLKLELGTLQETITVRHNAGQAPPPPPPPRPPSPPRAADGAQRPCTPSATGGHVRPPMKIRDTRPLYPPHLAAKGIGGTVLLDARIGTDGYVRDIAVVETPHADLGKAASDAVRQWQFTSTLLNCVASEVVMKVRVTFEVAD